MFNKQPKPKMQSDKPIALKYLPLGGFFKLLPPNPEFVWVKGAIEEGDKHECMIVKDLENYVFTRNAQFMPGDCEVMIVELNED